MNYQTDYRKPNAWRSDPSTPRPAFYSANDCAAVYVAPAVAWFARIALWVDDREDETAEYIAVREGETLEGWHGVESMEDADVGDGFENVRLSYPIEELPPLPFRLVWDDADGNPQNTDTDPKEGQK